MIAVILASLVPLAFKETNPVFTALDRLSACVFCVDYALRLLTADLKLHRGGWSFLLYPLTPMALVDLLAPAYLHGPFLRISPG